MVIYSHTGFRFVMVCQASPHTPNWVGLSPQKQNSRFCRRPTESKPLQETKSQSLYIFMLSKAFTRYVPSANYTFDEILLSLRKARKKTRTQNLEILHLPPTFRGSLWLLTLHHGMLLHFRFPSRVRCRPQFHC